MPPQNAPTNPAKTELRRRFRAVRNALSPAERADLSARIIAHIMRWIDDLQAPPATLALYLANPNEVNLDALIELLQARDVRVAAPAGDGFALVSSASTCSGAGAQSWRAADGIAIGAEEIDIVLLPGVAFGRDGSRLGQGGGWYDRVLQGSRAVLVGVAFGCQITDALPLEAHDLPVAWIASEGGVEAAR